MCALEDFFETISKKWSLLILEKISKEKVTRFSDLMANLDRISPSTLTLSLKKLESLGIVKRKVFEEIPPKVEYSLTEKGSELREVLVSLEYWCETNHDETKNCRCGKSKKMKNDLIETRKSKLNRIIEASLCACNCMAMMAGYYLFGNPIY